MTFAAGIKRGIPVVVFGMKSPKVGSAIDAVTLETPFPSIQDAIEFIVLCTENTALEYIEKFKKDSAYLAIVNTFNDPNFKALKDYQFKQQKGDKP